ncbi:MAG TPA: T9SS type A sorting domain-containing protein [Flavipsychrobacter sp.]
MNRLKFTLLITLAPLATFAQAVTEKKGIRIYEHHSSSINGGKPFGVGANGAMCGYDFVKHQHHGSFNPANMGKWSAAEVENIDMVEHGGPFGSNTPFGFTSATSTIWAGDIMGNGKTTFAKAPASFNYATATDVETIKNAHPLVGPNTVNGLTVGDVYISRVRGTNMYAAIKITAVKNLPSNYKSGDTASMYFDFDYKYGTAKATGIDDVDAAQSFTIHPNPAQGAFSIAHLPAGMNTAKAMVYITDVTGKTVHTQKADGKQVQHQLQAGLYMVMVTDGNMTTRQKLVITN